MLEAKRSGSAVPNPNYQTLLAFKPRQVLLAVQNTKMTTMKHCSSKTLTRNPDLKALLLHSVLCYLNRNGFSRALKRLLSESQIENDNWKSCSLNLEDMYSNYLETCTRAETKFDTYKEKELPIDVTNNKDGHCSSIKQNVEKKKKRKSGEVDNNAATDQFGTANQIIEFAESSGKILANDLLTDSNVELKDKKKSKKVSNSLLQTEQVNAQALQEPSVDTVCELPTDESTKKEKEKKKKKSMSISESCDGKVEQVQFDSLPVVNEKKCENSKHAVGDTKIDSASEVKSKDRKKKTKYSTNPLGDDVERCDLESKKGLITDKLDGNVLPEQPDSFQVPAKVKSKETVSSKGHNKTDYDAEGKSKDKKEKKKRKQSTDSFVENIEQCNSVFGDVNGIPSEEKKLKSKEKKRKKEGSVSETLSGGIHKIEDQVKIEGEKLDFVNLEDIIYEKKSSKKRKKMASNENDGQPDENLARHESKHKETEPSEETRNCERITKVNANTGENCPVGQNEFLNTSTKQSEEHPNGNLEKNGNKSAAQNTGRKQHEGSAEPKTVNAFQRVKLDKVEFADERLQDNSYWAKDGAEVGYGAKAQEILGQVRGRDFRHEKTKKKRGSYKGGQIDLQTHSVKFNYSDED
ncbi:hypothetical protein U1Q18_026660 [Sarracenia purpurea var. burkii]